MNRPITFLVREKNNKKKQKNEGYVSFFFLVFRKFFGEKLSLAYQVLSL